MSSPAVSTELPAAVPASPSLHSSANTVQGIVLEMYESESDDDVVLDEKRTVIKVKDGGAVKEESEMSIAPLLEPIPVDSAEILQDSFVSPVNAAVCMDVSESKPEEEKSNGEEEEVEVRFLPIAPKPSKSADSAPIQVKQEDTDVPWVYPLEWEEKVIKKEESEEDNGDVVFVRVGRPPVRRSKSGKDVYEVQRVLAHRHTIKDKEYFVQWLGYGVNQGSWLKEKRLKKCKKAVADYHVRFNARRSSNKD